MQRCPTIENRLVHVRSVSLGIVALLIGFQISNWISFVLTPQLRINSDFPMYYLAARTLLAGGQLYHAPLVPFGYTHPAFEAVLFEPLSKLPLWTAFDVWLACNVAFVGLVALLLKDRVLILPNPLLLLLAYFPISYAAMDGQDSIVALLIATLSFQLLRRSEFAAGLVLGLSVFRFQLLLVLLLPMLAWKMWRLVAGAALSGGFLIGISALITGWRAQITYFHLLQNIGATYWLMLANLRSLLAHLHATALLVPVSFVVMVLAVWAGRKYSSEHKFLLAVTVGCFLSYHFCVYDLCVLALPLIVLASEQKRYMDFVAPVLVVSAPTVMLFTCGTGYFWVLGISAPALFVPILWKGIINEGRIHRGGAYRDACFAADANV